MPPAQRTAELRCLHMSCFVDCSLNPNKQRCGQCEVQESESRQALAREHIVAGAVVLRIPAVRPPRRRRQPGRRRNAVPAAVDVELAAGRLQLHRLEHRGGQRARAASHHACGGRARGPQGCGRGGAPRHAQLGKPSPELPGPHVAACNQLHSPHLPASCCACCGCWIWQRPARLRPPRPRRQRRSRPPLGPASTAVPPAQWTDHRGQARRTRCGASLTEQSSELLRQRRRRRQHRQHASTGPSHRPACLRLLLQRRAAQQLELVVVGQPGHRPAGQVGAQLSRPAAPQRALQRQQLLGRGAGLRGAAGPRRLSVGLVGRHRMPLFRTAAGSSRPGTSWPSTAACKLACQRGSRSTATSPACRSWAAASAGSALSSGASPLAPPAAARRTASFTTHCLQQPWQRCQGWSDPQARAAQLAAGQQRRGPCPAQLRLHPPRPDVDFCDCGEAVLRHRKHIMQRCQRQRRHTSATGCSRHRSPQAGQSRGRHDSCSGGAGALPPASHTPPPAPHLVKQAAHGLVDESGGGQRPAHARQAAAVLLGVRLRGRRARASG